MSDWVAVLPEGVPPGLRIEASSALATVSGALDVDCGSLTCIDASGIAALLRASERMTSIRLYQPSALTHKVVTVLGLDAMFFADDDPPPRAALSAA